MQIEYFGLREAKSKPKIGASVDDNQPRDGNFVKPKPAADTNPQPRDGGGALTFSNVLK